MITEQSIIKYMNSFDYDLRKSHNGRWIDQKCSSDVSSFVADCILTYIEETGNYSFSSDDIQFFKYSNDNVKLIFKKPGTDSEAAANEYDKFFQQPMKMFANANILSEEKIGRRNIFQIKNKEILEYIASSEKNTLKFLRNYIEKVLLDSGLFGAFQDFFEKQTKDAYNILKEKYTSFIIRETNIEKITEPRRIFIKVINPLAYFRNAKGTENGRISKYPITYDMLMYNRNNFRDIYANKPKGVTRKEYALENPLQINADYYTYQSNKAKKYLKLFNDSFRDGLSEYLEDAAKDVKATQIHHIFPKSDFPEICYYLENLIALTPDQHFYHAHQNNDTHKINKDYQHLLLLAKTERIKDNLVKGQTIYMDYERIYEFPRFLHVLSVGFDDDDVEEIENMDWISVMNTINVHYGKI